MPFDVQGARNAGYSDDEIAQKLAESSHFDLNGARQAGYADSEIIERLAQHASKAPRYSEPTPYEPTISDRLFGGRTPGGTSIPGYLPTLGEHALSTGKEIGARFMQGGADVGNLLEQLDVATTSTGDVRDRALTQLREQAKDTEAFWQPQETTPLGDVMGGLARAAPAIMLGGGSPIPLVAAETMKTGEELIDQDVDAATAGKIAAARGVASYLGMKLPGAGKTLATRLLTGTVGTPAIGVAEREKRKETLEEAGYGELAKQEPSPYDWKQLLIDAGLGSVFGLVAHAHAQPEAAAQPAPRVEPHIGPETPPAGQLALPPPEGPLPTAPARPAPPREYLERLGFDPEFIDLVAGEPPALPPPEAIPNPRGRAPIEQEIELERMGLTPDVIGNLIALEDKAEAARAGRVLPPPDTTLQVSPEGVARPAVDVEEEARRERDARDLIAAQQAARAKAETERAASVGLTPDVQANLQRMKQRGAVGAAVPPLPGLPRPPIGDIVAPAPPAAAAPAPPAEIPPAPSQEGAGPATGRAASRPAVDHGLLSPSGRVSKRAEAAARERNRVAIFGPEGLQKTEPAQPSEAEALRRQAAELRGLAERGMGPKKNLAAAAKLEARADELERAAAPTTTPAPVSQGEKSQKIAKPKSALEFLAGRGGLSIEALEKEGIDRADMAGVRGFKRPFTKKGMSLDAAAEALHEAGYPVADEAGRPDANKALDLIDRELKGQRTHPVQAAPEGLAPEQVERRRGEQRMTGERRAQRAPGAAPAPETESTGERKMTAQMNVEELRRELLTSHVTGLPNRRAYQENPRLPHQALLDVDSLKWVNDNMSHGSGDEVLKTVGQALREAAGEHAYHFSGDEFAIEGASPEALHDIMERVNERLAKAQIEITRENGDVVTLDGIGLSYGLGENLETADANLARSKTEREAQAVRATRGEKPRGATIRRGGREEGPDHEGNPPAGEVREPESRYPARAERAEPDETGQHVTLTHEGHVSARAREEEIELPQPRSEEEFGGIAEPQQQDLFTRADARPAATDQDIENANAVLRELEDAASSDEEHDIKSFASAFNQAYRTDHGASLIGQVMRATDDFAALARVFRDPRIEYLRYFVTNNANRIVAQSGVSSRLPGSSYIFPTGKDTKWVKALLERTGGGRLWMLHNHPSARANPSDDDVAATQGLSRELGLPITHVIVNHDHYGRIMVLPDGTITSNEVVPIPERAGTLDTMHEPSKPHPFLGREIISPTDLMTFGEELQKKDGYVTVIGTSGVAGKVRTLGDMPVHLLADLPQLKKQLRRFAVQNGNMRLMLAGLPGDFFEDRANRRTLDQLLHNGFLTDAVDERARSFGVTHATRLPMRVQTYGAPAGTAVEVKPRESGKAAEEQKDLFNANAAERNRLAAEQRKRDAKRSPNKDVSPDTGAPGDLFTLNKQLEIKEPLEPPRDVDFEEDTSSDEEQFVVRAMRDGEEVGRLSLELNEQGDAQITSADVDKAEQGRGIGQELIRRAYAVAKANGLKLVSDSIVSRKQLQAYEALRRQGWTIEYTKPDKVKAVLDDPNRGGVSHRGEEDTRVGVRPVVKKIKPPAGYQSKSDATRNARERGIARARRIVEEAGVDWNDIEMIRGHEHYKNAVRRYGPPNAISEGESETALFGKNTGSLFVDDETGKPVAYAPSSVRAGRNVVRETPGEYGAERREGEERRRVARGGRREGERKPGEDRGYAKLAQRAIDEWNSRVGWRYGPLGNLPAKREYLERRYRALGDQEHAADVARQIGKSLEGATKADSEAIYDYMTNRDGDPQRIEDPERRRAAIAAKRKIDSVGQELVDAGLISKEAYEEHRGEYLPRLYLKHVLEGLGKQSDIGLGLRSSDLGYTKKRKLGTSEGDLETRVLLGEIKDPAFLASFGMAKMGRDLAILDFLRDVAKNKTWVPAAAMVEWRGKNVSPFWLEREAQALRRRARAYSDADKETARKAADEMERLADEAKEKLGGVDLADYEQIPDSPRYGALRGTWVRKEIYDDVVGVYRIPPANASWGERLFGDGGLLSKATAWWKFKSVLLNPPTIARNILSNMPLLHLSGVPFHRVYSGEIIGKAVSSIANKDRYYQVAKKYGVFTTTFANTEAAHIRDSWLAVQKLDVSGWGKAKLFAAQLHKGVSNVYAVSEAIFKIAKIRDAMEREGKSAADAALEAHDALFDYTLVPRGVRYMRNQPLGAPFLTFMYKAAAKLTKEFIKHPARYIPYVAIPYILAELIKNQYDVNDEDIAHLRKALPSWMNERGHMLLLPWKDKEGRWQPIDMGYLAPWGAFADLWAAATHGKGLKEAANMAVFGGPVPEVVGALQTNTDQFTGKPIVNEADPPWRQYEELMQWVWNLAVPPFLSDRGAVAKIAGSEQINKYGEQGLTRTQAIARMFGLNVYPIDPTKSRAQNIRAMQAAIREKKARRSELVKDKTLSAEQRSDVRAAWNRMIRADQKELQQYRAESAINPKLAAGAGEEEPPEDDTDTEAE